MSLWRDVERRFYVVKRVALLRFAEFPKALYRCLFRADGLPNPPKDEREQDDHYPTQSLECRYSIPEMNFSFVDSEFQPIVGIVALPVDSSA